MQIGASVAKYAGKNVFKRLTGEQSYTEENYQESLKKAFLGTDEDILKSNVPRRSSFASLTRPSQIRSFSGIPPVAQPLPPS